jgi:sulfur carrier protein
MMVELNGAETRLPSGATVADAIAAAGAAPDGRGVAAAVDGEVVPRDSWRELRLLEGQRIEIVMAVQGG